MSTQSRLVCLAPMLEYTDRHFRYLLRLITRNTWLYTEMITTGAILFGQHRDRYLRFSSTEHPLALQLGGSDPQALAECAQIAEQYGYDEVNLNVGCPSDRVQSGQFGASLMANPQLVSDCMVAMQQKVDIPVTIKTRIGIDYNDDYAQLQNLVEILIQSGTQVFIVHARKAWLDGLSPKDNREIPPLRYEYVYQLKRDFPEYEFIINGGITSIPQMQEHIEHVDGVMIGREAYGNCYMMHEVDEKIYQESTSPLSRKQILQQYLHYAENELAQGVPFGHLSKHVLGLFHACPGARLFRREVSENAHKPGADTDLLERAAKLVDCP